MSTITRTLSDFRPTRSTLLYGTLVLYTEFLLVAAYFLFGNADLVQPLYTVLGLVWVNVGVWVLTRTRVPTVSDRTRRRAAVAAGAYFVILAVAGGIVGPGSVQGLHGFTVSWLPPGWGPALIYGSPLVQIVLMPAKVVGYVALAYLVYATIVDAAGTAVSGVLGLLSCVSCSGPIVASFASSVFGGGSAVASAAFGLSYELSTLVFLVTVALLHWRPLAK